MVNARPFLGDLWASLRIAHNIVNTWRGPLDSMTEVVSLSIDRIGGSFGAGSFRSSPRMVCSSGPCRTPCQTVDSFRPP